MRHNAAPHYSPVLGAGSLAKPRTHVDVSRNTCTWSRDMETGMARLVMGLGVPVSFSDIAGVGALLEVAEPLQLTSDVVCRQLVCYRPG